MSELDDLPDSEGAPHPILAYVANLEAANTALRAALEQAVKTCSECDGTGPLFYGDGGKKILECRQCKPWRDLLANKS